jgi:hypothetical protein
LFSILTRCRLADLEAITTSDSNRGISDKEFHKAMAKLRERGSSAVPPKKSASAYIIFGKEVRKYLIANWLFNRKG